MAIGAEIGMNLINKGIDQFSYGVGQEYRRHERHALRDYAEHDMDNAWKREFVQKMQMAQRYGIHPLAIMGVGGGAGRGVSVPSTMTPSGSFTRFPSAKLSDDERRILNANARKAEAEAGIVEKELERMGQNPGDYHVGNGSMVQGQPDGDIYGTPSGVDGVEPSVSRGQRYTLDREGNFYLIPSQSVEQAFSEEGTLQNRFLYEMRDANFPRKVYKLKNFWNDPELREFKFRFLSTRPVADRPDRVVLWNGINWQSFRKTPENQHRIFKEGNYVIKATKKKKHNIKYDNYRGMPLS